ncbi:hypothetical protein ACFFMN_08800 [Planobispora siamensis]|uniref:Uncharacterized protein n=1 Tax=Planobispora siamensis TaxID=936338 RepID=A0A8J3WKQ9_9ACTN|nr:hypothetical protein [Planobispora siamensis]GIH91081.1 hypothetical protein Psi01_17110 [Planobispora siamensis]
MDAPDPAGHDDIARLKARVRALLTDAGFINSRTSEDDPYSVRLRSDADLGVVVVWDPTDAEGMSGRYPGIRAAVHLAVMSVLTNAGYQAVFEPEAAMVYIATGPPFLDGAWEDDRLDGSRGR